MIIDVYTYVHNEEFMLPYFFRHYGPIARKITVFDNESTDGTVDFCKKQGAEVIPVITGGKHRVDMLRMYMNEGYRVSRGEADWVICAEGDEFFWHHNLLGLLELYKNEGVTLPKTQGYDMVSNVPPSGDGQIYDEIKEGFPNVMYSKRGIFNPFVDINFDYGGHKCAPQGPVVENETPEIFLLHYRFLGERYFADRYEIRRQRMCDEDASRGLGAGCLKDHMAQYRMHMERARGNIVRVLE